MMKKNRLRDVLGHLPGSILAFTLLTSVAHAQWSSPGECYEAHLRLAAGRYPLPGDDISFLMKHCEYEYKSQGCNFRCEYVKAGWELAVLPGRSHQRDVYMRLYFKSAQLKRIGCDMTVGFGLRPTSDMVRFSTSKCPPLDLNSRPIEVVRVRTTDAGRLALDG
jgi:hypothetical protein